FASIVLALALLPPVAHLLLGWRLPSLPAWLRRPARVVHSIIVVVLAVFVAWLLSGTWEPLSALRSPAENFLFVAVVIVGLLGFFWLLQLGYARILRFCLRFKLVFLAVPCALTVLGFCVWLGFPRLFGWLPAGISGSAAAVAMAE